MRSARRDTGGARRADHGGHSACAPGAVSGARDSVNFRATPLTHPRRPTHPATRVTASPTPSVIRDIDGDVVAALDATVARARESALYCERLAGDRLRTL